MTKIQDFKCWLAHAVLFERLACSNADLTHHAKAINQCKSMQKSGIIVILAGTKLTCVLADTHFNIRYSNDSHGTVIWIKDFQPKENCTEIKH